MVEGILHRGEGVPQRGLAHGAAQEEARGGEEGERRHGQVRDTKCTPPDCVSGLVGRTNPIRVAKHPRRVKTVTGQVKETSYGSEETVDGVAMRKAMGLMDPVDSVEVMETSGDAEGEPADKTFHESIESRELRALTQRMSAWHNYGGTVGGGGSGGGGGGSSGGGSAVQQQEKALTSSVSVQELEMRIEALDAALNDPNNTLDIDDTLDEIARLKAEKKAQKGWFGWG